MHNVPLDRLSKFPYLLPRKDALTGMIIADIHKKLHHGGTAITATAIQQVYWILTIRLKFRSIVQRCVTCAKTMGKPYKTHDPPSLPRTRVRSARPFAVTGVDFTRTLYIKELFDEQKAYICLFTCASTRAIHLEIVTDLSTETFLLAF